MLFNQLIFLYFFVGVWLLRWLCAGRVQARNAILLAASVVFYGYWDVRFLLLIGFSTVLDYVVGLKLDTKDRKAAWRWLMLSVASNLGTLAFFKYFNFFLDNIETIMGQLGFAGGQWTLSILLPVGISFYTFQTLSYSIDRYYGKIEAERNFLTFACYVTFFPQLVAGPIVRAREFLDQLQAKAAFAWADQVQGLQLILWGLFKKAVVADNLAALADPVFATEGQLGIATRLLAAVAFTGQIYGDFSGYTDIARGTAQMLGFRFPLNFRRPYFVSDPSSFWRRWHMTLSTWLRDYLYIPLGGNRGGELFTHRNLFLTMLIGGLWHGAAWNYVLWGAFHGVWLGVHRLWSASTKDMGFTSGLAYRLLAFACFHVLLMITWVLFRVNSLWGIVAYFRPSGGLTAGLPLMLQPPLVPAVFGCVMVLIYDAIHERDDTFETPLWGRSPLIQISAMFCIYAATMFLGRFSSSAFIYFQF